MPTTNIPKHTVGSPGKDSPTLNWGKTIYVLVPQASILRNTRSLTPQELPQLTNMEPKQCWEPILV